MVPKGRRLVNHLITNYMYTCTFNTYTFLTVKNIAEVLAAVSRLGNKCEHPLVCLVISTVGYSVQGILVHDHLHADKNSTFIFLSLNRHSMKIQSSTFSSMCTKRQVWKELKPTYQFWIGWWLRFYVKHIATKGFEIFSNIIKNAWEFRTSQILIPFMPASQGGNWRRMSSP